MPKNRKPSRDDGCCSVHFLKYILFIFNFLFYLAGLAILGVGVWTLFFRSHYAPLLVTKTYIATTYIMIGAGGLVLLVGVLGCIGVLKENRCCLLMFTFLLLLIFLVEAVAGILCYIYSEQIGQELKQSLNTTMGTQYSVDPTISKAVELLHLEHGCCGASSAVDWRSSVWFKKVNSADDPETLLVPDFCCRTPSARCGRRDHPSNIYYDIGCIDALKQEIQEHEIILGAIALGISTVQLFGMIMSCCLYVKLKDFEDEKVTKRSSKSYYQ